jgi:hypothetical protein
MVEVLQRWASVHRVTYMGSSPISFEDAMKYLANTPPPQKIAFSSARLLAFPVFVHM